MYDDLYAVFKILIYNCDKTCFATPRIKPTFFCYMLCYILYTYFK